MALMAFLSGVRLKDVLPLGTMLRALLTFVAVADAFLAVQLWLRGDRGHHHPSTAGDMALLGLASQKVLTALVLTAAAVYLVTRPKRAFRRVLILITVFAALVALATSQKLLMAVAVTDCLAALLASSLWPEVGDRRSSQLGSALLAGSVAVTAWLFLLQRPNHRMGFLFALVLVLALVAAISAIALLDRNPSLPWSRSLSEALALYRAHGRSGVSPFALMSDKKHFTGSDQPAFLAFACRAGCALALGPAIGPSESGAEVEAQFRSAARRRGWRPAFYQVPGETAERIGHCVRLAIGSEALVDVPSFGLEGSRMARLRHDVVRARRQEMSFRLVAERELQPGMAAALEAIDHQARRTLGLGEMTFSVGRRDEPAGVERTYGVALDRDGRPMAYVTWLWLPASATMVLDEVKRHDHAPPGALDLAIFESLERFKGRADHASLGLAPLTGGRRAGSWAVVEAVLRRTLGISSFNPGLYSFKAKFNPCWERRYLVVEHVLDLPAALAATLLLHYPGLTRRWREVGWSRRGLGMDPEGEGA
jgi:lysylphosphatidylglycerol synthetase-like protein (DUF2156 family)